MSNDTVADGDALTITMSNPVGLATVELVTPASVATSDPTLINVGDTGTVLLICQRMAEWLVQNSGDHGSGATERSASMEPVDVDGKAMLELVIHKLRLISLQTVGLFSLRWIPMVTLTLIRMTGDQIGALFRKDLDDVVRVDVLSDGSYVTPMSGVYGSEHHTAKIIVVFGHGNGEYAGLSADCPRFSNLTTGQLQVVDIQPDGSTSNNSANIGFTYRGQGNEKIDVSDDGSIVAFLSQPWPQPGTDLVDGVDVSFWFYVRDYEYHFGRQLRWRMQPKMAHHQMKTAMKVACLSLGTVNLWPLGAAPAIWLTALEVVMFMLRTC